MKKFTLSSYLMLLMAFAISFNTHAADKVNIFDGLVTVMEKSTAAGNLPAIIDNAGATRGAGFNGQYVFVASRQNGDHVYYWDVNTPDDPAQELDMTGVSGGTFTVSDLTAVGNHIFVSNMDFAGGTFKLYHWAGIDAQPTVLINMPSIPFRFGDAFTVLGNPDDWAAIVVSGHGSKDLYVWNMENGQLVSETPEITTLADLSANLNFARATLAHGAEEFAIISGPLGVVLLDDENAIILEIEQSFFPGWPMYVQVFHHLEGRYLAFMHVKDNPAANVMYVLDITEGADVAEALTILEQGTFEEKVLHTVDLGSVPNGNASVSMDVVIDPFGNLWLMGFAAGNGFVVQKLGDAFAYLLPFEENFAGEGLETPPTWLPADWMNVDADNDSNGWVFGFYEEEDVILETYMLSFSWTSATGALTPDNWLITPEIITEAIVGEEIMELSFNITSIASDASFRAERYEVLVSTTDTEPDSFTMVWEEVMPEDVANWAWQQRVLDLSAYAGESIYIAFRHFGTTDLYGIAIEKVEVKKFTPQEPPVLADLTLNVKMKVWADMDKFDPENDFVDVAGDFNEWGTIELVLTALDDEFLTHTITIEDLEVGETFEFKFRINGSWSDETSEFPSGGPNRSVTIEEGVNEFTYWYNNDEPDNVPLIADVSLSIFPNPASSHVNIVSEIRMQQVVVSDITGRTIASLNVDAFELKLNTSAFNNGIYMVSIYTENGVAVSKLQINK